MSWLFQNITLSEFYLTLSEFYLDKIGQNRDEIWIKGHGLALDTLKTCFLELAKCIKEVVSTYFEMFVYKKSRQNAARHRFSAHSKSKNAIVFPTFHG